VELIGGLLLRDGEATVSPSALETMAGKVAGMGSVTTSVAGPIGLFSSSERGAIAHRDGMWAVGQFDLTNLTELQTRVGGAERDGDLIVALYAREGEDFIRRLRGAFAFVLWDGRRRTLLGAVDHFGMRRLYTAVDGHRAALASRPGALVGVPGFEAGVDPTAVFQYLNFGYVPAPASIFAGIERVPPGHRLRVTSGEAACEPYWDMRYVTRPLRVDEGARLLAERTEDAVGRALEGVATKETGAFLSGGTDSSAVVGLMGRRSGEPVNAFSIGFREPRYDELEYAELTARHFEAAHYVKILSADEALASLPRLVEVYDEPLGNNSAIGTLACAELARECGVRRLLAGDGGDEIFGGNERYAVDRVFARYHLVPAPVRRGLLDPVFLALPDRGLTGRIRRYVRRANIPNPRRFYSYEFFFAQEGRAYLDPDFTANTGTEAAWATLQSHFDRVEAAAELHRLLYLDLKLTIGDNDLFKVVRTAELAGMEVRFPLLDLPLVEFAATLPASLIVRGVEKRYLFKRAFRTLLPAATLTKRKHGFGVPTSLWLKSHPGFRDLVRETLLSSRARQRGYFRPGAIEEIFQLHAADETPFYGDVIWTLLMLELWHRRHLDGARS